MSHYFKKPIKFLFNLENIVFQNYLKSMHYLLHQKWSKRKKKYFANIKRCKICQIFLCDTHIII